MIKWQFKRYRYLKKKCRPVKHKVKNWLKIRNQQLDYQIKTCQVLSRKQALKLNRYFRLRILGFLQHLKTLNSIMLNLQLTRFKQTGLPGISKIMSSWMIVRINNHFLIKKKFLKNRYNSNLVLILMVLNHNKKKFLKIKRNSMKEIFLNSLKIILRSNLNLMEIKKERLITLLWLPTLLLKLNNHKN